MVTIVHMTVLFDLETTLNPVDVVHAIPSADFNTSKFSAVKVKMLNPKYSALIFGSGKVVLTGIDSEEKARIAASNLINNLTPIIPTARFGNLNIKNIVGTLDLGLQLDLVKFREVMPEYASYDPQHFSGLIYRTKQFKCVAVIFSSSKLNITGVSQKTELYDFSNHLMATLYTYQKM